MYLTVLLPTYNNSKYIYGAVKSILNQTHKEFEFLIIDDGSEDDTVKIIKSFNDPRIKLIRHDTNIGLGNTLNQGLKLSSNPIVARMDGDDISLPDRFKTQVEYLKNHPEVDILSCRYAVMTGDKIRYVVNTSEHHDKIVKKLALHSEIIHPGSIFNKMKILESGGYKNIPIEDYELWLRLKDKVIFGNVPEILLIKRYHEKAISQQLEIKNKSVYVYLDKYYQNFKEEFKISDTDEYKGWKEYFYGNKNKARYYFRKLKWRILVKPRVAVAYIITYSGTDTFQKFKELRLKFRIYYVLKYFKKEHQNLRRFLKKFNQNLI